MTKVVTCVSCPDMIETGSEPEFFVTIIPKFEIMAAGIVRIYLATQKGDTLRLEYTAVVPADALASMGRMCLHMAAEGHTWAAFMTEALTN